MDLDGRTILLTGATGGLGRAIATALAARGAALVLSSRKQPELEALALELPGDRHRVIVSDLAEEGEAERLVGSAGPIDGLIANAGLAAGGRVERMGDELGVALRVNFEAPVRMAAAAVPGLLDRGAGHIVFIGSLQSKIALPRSAIYSATKFGVRGFALSLREDLHGTGVGVSLVLPGFIRDAGIFARSGQRPPGGLGTSSPAEVGDGVVTAIERNRAEVQVAPLLQRLGVAIAHRRPGLAARITRGSASKAAERVVEGQRAHRG